MENLSRVRLNEVALAEKSALVGGESFGRVHDWNFKFFLWVTFRALRHEVAHEYGQKVVC